MGRILLGEGGVTLSTHVLASHPAAGHLEVELAVVLRVERVLGAGVEQRTHGLVAVKHQIDVACEADAALLDKLVQRRRSSSSGRQKQEYCNRVTKISEAVIYPALICLK